MALNDFVCNRRENKSFKKNISSTHKEHDIYDITNPKKWNKCIVIEAHLQDSLVIDFIKHSSIDLIGLQRHPIKHRHTEFGLDGFLNLYS